MCASMDYLLYVGTAIYTGKPSTNIYVGRLDASAGKVTPLESATESVNPGTLAIDPTGAYMFVANADSDNVVIFRINPHTGCLHPTGEVFNAKAPTCVTFLPVD